MGDQRVPQKTKGPGPPPTKEQVEKAQEDEHAYLLRRHRIDQEDTLKFKGAMNTFLNKQLGVIDTLSVVKETLMIEVSVAKNEANDRKDNNVFKELRKSLRHGDSVDAKIKQRRQYIHETEMEMRKQQKILHSLVLNLEMPTDRIIEEGLRKAERHVAVLENKLYGATVKFNLMVVENKNRRQEVEDILHGRTSFNAAFQKMVKLLHHGNTIMLDLVEMTKVAYEHRDEAQARVTMVGKHGSTNKDTKAVMMADLTKQVDHYASLKHFVSLKGQKRDMKELHGKVEARNAEKRNERRRVIENYRSILQRITSLSGEEQLGKIAELICRNDVANFSRFLHVMDLHDELEKAKVVVGECQGNIQVYKTKVESRRTKARTDRLATLRAENELRQAEVTAAYEGMQANRQHLDDLLMGVEALYELTGVEDKILARCLGGNEIPTEHNLWRFLETVERYTVDTLARMTFVEQSHRADELPLKTKVIRPAQPDRPIATLNMIDPQEPCAICAETAELSILDLDSVLPVVLEMGDIVRSLDRPRPNAEKNLHSLSLCPLPRSKKLEAKSRNTNTLGGP